MKDLKKSRSSENVGATATSVRRRTVVGAAAWATPLIVASVATPAFAASAETLSFHAPATAEVGTLAQEAIYATIQAGGMPAEGVIVTFSVSDPAVAGFGAAGASLVTAVTNAAGIAYPPAMLLKTAGNVEVTATANGRTESTVITVSVPTSTGTMRFNQPTVNAAAASTFALAGTLTRTAGHGYPATVTLTYPAGFNGPATVDVDQATGEFLVPGVTAGTTDGTITANASGFGSATVTITLVLGYIATTRAVYSAGKGLASPRGTYVITGTITRVTPGAALPATITLAWNSSVNGYENATGFSNGQTVPVDQTTGTFTLPTLTPIDTGRTTPENTATGGSINLSAPNYQSMRVVLYNRDTAARVDQYNKMSTSPATIAFAPGETRDVTGVATQTSVTRAVTYPAGFTGPATVVIAASGAYTLRGVKAPDYVTSGALEVKGSVENSYVSRGQVLVL